ncbi:hypothetical protein J3B02_006052, partial [Coemansia erecta]
MDHRREELERKREKLAELRRQREERKRQAMQAREQQTSSTLSSSESNIDNIDINDLVNSLVGDRTRMDASGSDVSAALSREASSTGRERSGTASDAAAAAAAASASAAAAVAGAGAGAGAPTIPILPGQAAPKHEFRNSELVVFDFAPRERVVYNKEVQTAATDSADVEMLTEEEVNRRVRELRERDERARVVREEDRLRREAEAAERDAQREAELRRLTDAQRGTILESSTFAGFIDRASRVVERALDVEYDVTVDYARAGATDTADTRPQLALVAALGDERTRNRA